MFVSVFTGVRAMKSIFLVWEAHYEEKHLKEVFAKAEDAEKEKDRVLANLGDAGDGWSVTVEEREVR